MSAAPEAHVWRLDPRALEDGEVHARCLALLSPAERARHDRIAAPARRLELAAAHALVRLALAEVTGAPASMWRVRRGAIGEPLVEGPVDGVHVSVTHTPGLVACVVATGRAVGVDAEQVSPRVPYMRIAEQRFAPPELDELRRLDDAARIDRFFLLWSVREALAKARGEACRDAVCVRLADDGGVELAGAAATGWHVRWSRPGPAHVIAVCVAADGAPVTIHDHVGLP